MVQTPTPTKQIWKRKEEEKIRYFMSPITCYLPPTPTARDPTPANSPNMHNGLVCQDRHFCFGELAYAKTKIKFKEQKFIETPLIKMLS